MYFIFVDWLLEAAKTTVNSNVRVELLMSIVRFDRIIRLSSTS